MRSTGAIAPDSNKSVLILASMLLAVSNTVCAQSILPVLQFCSTISDIQERVSCYDAAVSSFSESQSGQGAARSTTGSETDAAEKIQDASTISTAAELFPQDQDSVSTTATKSADFSGDEERVLEISNARHNDITGWSIEFTNGETWQQVGSDRYEIKKGESYKITRGTLYSFLLGNLTDNRKIRITRIK